MDPLGIDYVDVSVQYRAAPILDRFSLHLSPGSRTCLLGRSGIGKSTVLKLAQGAVLPSRGSVLVGGQVARLGMNGVSVASQNPHLFPWLSVQENIAYPLKIRRIPRTEARQRCEDIAGNLGILDAFPLRTYQLSGGMAQRVSLARALVTQPRLLLLDEPFASLDALTRLELRSWLSDWLHKHAVSSVVVTHDVEDFFALGERAIVLQPSRGGVGAQSMQLFDREGNEDFLRDSILSALVGAPDLRR